MNNQHDEYSAQECSAPWKISAQIQFIKYVEVMCLDLIKQQYTTETKRKSYNEIL
jgi:hypothetical protein